MASDGLEVAAKEAEESAEAGKKVVALKSSEGEVFEVEFEVAKQSETLKKLIDEGCLGEFIPLPNVSARILSLIIKYCRKHSGPVPDPDDYRYEIHNHGELDVFDAEFVKLPQATLFDLIQAANYLSIQGLLDLMCRTVADMMRGKSPKKIRKMFHIQNDYTPEEEAEVRMENWWAFN